MEHGERFVLCHVYLVEHAEAALHGALVYRPAAQRHLAVFESVGADERGGVRVEVERNVPLRALEHGGKVLGQNVFAGGLRPDQQQVCAREYGGYRLAPDLAAVIFIFGAGDASGVLRRCGKAAAKVLDSGEHFLVYTFAAQKIEHVYPSILCLIPMLIL